MQEEKNTSLNKHERKIKKRIGEKDEEEARRARKGRQQKLAEQREEVIGS